MSRVSVTGPRITGATSPLLIWARGTVGASGTRPVPGALVSPPGVARSGPGRGGAGPPRPWSGLDGRRRTSRRCPLWARRLRPWTRSARTDGRPPVRWRRPSTTTARRLDALHR
jgi:hypothetical protein